MCSVIDERDEKAQRVLTDYIDQLAEGYTIKDNDACLNEFVYYQLITEWEKKQVLEAEMDLRMAKVVSYLGYRVTKTKFHKFLCVIDEYLHMKELAKTMSLEYHGSEAAVAECTLNA